MTSDSTVCEATQPQHDALLTPQEVASQTTKQQLRSLLDKGQYVSAYQHAVQAWGPYETWQDEAQIACLIALLRGLGRRRSASYLEIKCYRAQPEQSDNALRYFMHTLSRKGAMACYDIAEQWLTATQADPAQHADWQIAKALVLGRVRDFSQAQQLLDDASQQPNAADWAARIRLRLWEDEGRWEEALEGAKARYVATQCQMALEMVIRLTQAQEGPQAALTELLRHLPQSENISLWQEAATLHFLLHQTEDALACLQKMGELQVLGQDKDDQYADWLCGQLYLETRDLQAARAALGRLKDTFSTLVLKRLQHVTTLSPVLKLAVPHVTQKYMTCAPSSIAAVVRYWGEPADEDAIAEQICFQGTADHLQRQWLTDNGWSYVDFDLSLAGAEAVLSRGIPFTLVTTQGMSSHLQVVKGIDREAGYLYLMDPSVNMESKILTEETCQLEAVHGPRCRAIVPNNKQHLFVGLDLPAQNLYPLRHALDSALDKQDIPQARSLITQLEALAPDHRITQLSHRSLAVVLRDEADIERYTDQLLAAYPTTTFLILSKYHSMRARCGHREAYLWLSAQFKQAKSIEVFNLLLEDRAVLEDGNAAIEALADRAVMWTNAEYFWLKGHDSWCDGDKETALRLYGWALYLDPSNDAYLRSYYVANVDQGRVEEALAQLQALYDASIAVSSSMAYSLYRAYCMKDEDHLGLAVLKQACEVQQEDVALITFYLGELGKYGQWDQVEAAYAQYEHCLPHSERLMISARQAFAKGENDQAITRYEALLALQPGNDSAVEYLLTSYNRAGQADKAQAYLDAQISQYGESLRALDLMVNHTRDDAKRVQALVRITELYPLEYDSARRLAYYYLSRDETAQAESLCKALLEKNANHADNLLLQAEICLKRGDWAQAKANAKAAITHSPNSDAAFEALMRTHTAPAEKVAVIREFGEVLKTLPNADDGVWNFWHFARNWLDVDEQRAFCDAMIERHGQNWCVWVVSAYQRELTGHITEAIDDLAQAAKRSPLTVRIFAERARMLSCVGRYDEATPVFDYAMTLSPGWTFLATEYYQHLVRIAELKKGRAVLERCLQYNDDDGVLLGHLAESYLDNDEPEQSLALFVEAVRHLFHYPWAWNKLHRLSEQLDDGQTWRELMAERQEHYASHVDTWLIAAQLASDLPERCDHLQRAIALSPHHLGAHIDLVDAYIAMGKDEAVYALINSDKWDGAAPITLAIKEPTLLFERGDYIQAMVILDGILTRNPRFEEGWLLRMKCAVHAERFADALASGEKLEGIAGNSLEALYEVGRVYEEHGEATHQARILPVFEAAYAMGPHYGNIAFAYLDRLITEAHYVTARHVANAMDDHFDKPWIDVRRFEIFAAQGQEKQAIEMYQQVVACGEETYWLYAHPLEWAEEHKATSLLQALWTTLEQAMTAEALNVVTADVYADWCEKQQGLAGLRALLDKDVGPAVWRVFCTTYLGALSQKQSLPEPGFWETFDARIYEDMGLASKKGYVLLRAEHYYEAKVHYVKMGVMDNPMVPGYALYHTAYVCSATKDYALLETVMPQFLSRPKDSCYNNGLVWYCYVQLRLGQRIDPEVLGQITEQGLMACEKSMLAIMHRAVGFDADRDAGLSTSIETLTAMPSTFRLDSTEVLDLSEAYIRYLLANSTGNWWKKSRLKRRLRARLRQ